MLKTLAVGIGWAGLVLIPPAAQSQALFTAVENGTPSLELRLSFERSDVSDNSTDAATALNLRTRLGYRTGPFAESTFFLQFQDVSAFIDDYSPEDNDFDVIADPRGTSIHQAYVDYEGLAASNTHLRIGRQEIVLDDGRLFSNVNWRQHAQSFDAALATNESIDRWVLTGGIITRVRTVGNTFIDLDHLLLLQGAYDGIDGHKLTVHGYFLDSPGDASNDRDNATYGARLSGEADTLEYFADYNLQTGYADNSKAGGTMLNAFGALNASGFKFGVGYTEISGAGGGNRAFDTLFGTAHEFNGWSDQFGATNGGKLDRGLKEIYFLVGGSRDELSWLARFHRFDQETGSEAYGNEFNLLLSTPLAEKVTGLLMFAGYTADGGNTSGVADADETVFVVRVDYAF